jgi:glycosidase
MKRKSSLCLLLALLMLLAACGQAAPQESAAPADDAAQDESPAQTEAPVQMDLSGRYPLSEAGEAIVNDVDMSHAAVTADNARVFYEIFVGSFSDSDGDGIGDLRGIINRFDYLNDGDPSSGLSLGIEGIWLTPVFLSPSYHKYDVTDYYTIDPAFGTVDDLRELATLCHQRNVKLILDLPINHTGSENAWFKEFKAAHANGDTGSQWYDFYHWCSKEDFSAQTGTFRILPDCSDYYECNFADNMPELNFDNPDVRQAVLDVAKYYLDLGVDGFRFDAAKYVYVNDNPRSASFWNWFTDELRSLRPDIYMVAEVWDADIIAEQYYPYLNCFNFTLPQATGQFARSAKGDDLDRLTSYIQEYLKRIHALRDDAMLVPFLSNHDMDRAAGFMPVSSGQMAMAANLYLLGPGSPFLYYGEEIGIKGSRGSSFTDANRRLAMLWGDGDSVRDPSGSDYKGQADTDVARQLGDGDSLYTYYKRLLMIRLANPEIARGEYRAVSVPDSALGGFVSTLDGSSVLVLHNVSDESLSLDLSTLNLSFTQLSAFIGQGEASLDGSVLTLGPKTSAVLR